MQLPVENQNTLPGFFQRYTPASGVKAILYRTTHALQVRELNESQAILHDRITGIANAIFADGDIASGLELVRLTDDPNDYDIQITAGEVFIQGHIYKVEEVKLNIPLNTKVAIGLRMTEEVINESDDPSLKDPAVGTANFDNPGAMRLLRSLAWGWQAETGASDNGSGTFFPVFSVDNGVPVTRGLPPAYDAVVQHVAKYDYDAHKNYAVRGLQVSYLMTEDGDDHFNLSEGVGNIRGYKRERLTSTRLTYPQDFTTKLANNEPHIFAPDGDGIARIAMNRFPIHTVGEVFGTKLKTSESVTRGAFVGGTDQLAESSVLQVLEVRQGSTVFVVGNDYTVAGGNINWSPLGDEPAPGGTYEVTYQYQAVITPTEITATHITVTGLVAGTYINFDYLYKLPRVDLITMDSEGNIHRTKGESVERNPAPKHAPEEHLPLGTIAFDWMNAPVVSDVRNLSVPVSELQQMKKQLADLFDLLAIERLRVDMALSDPSAKKGVFVDPFVDNDLRDMGTAQTAAIVNGVLTLPFQATMHQPDNTENVSRPILLPYEHEGVVEQLYKSACMRINPYAAFDPLPAKVRLMPPVDRWIVTLADDLTTVAALFININIASPGRPTTVRTTVEFRQVGLRVLPVQFIRQRDVGFIIDGFGPGENLVEITFDGLDVTHSINEDEYEADLNGHVEGAFHIPPNVRTGAKAVFFRGIGGTIGNATYVAEGTIVQRIMQMISTTVTDSYDPLAQTFMLPEDRIITGIQLRFCLLGDLTNQVFVQVRETQVGIPTQVVLAEGTIDANTITLEEWTDIFFDVPLHLPSNREYCVVILTDDKYHSVGIARLGDYVTEGNGPNEGWVTAQPYQIGALLASSNASTWTPINDADLTFRLMGAKFTANQATVPLGNINAVNVTDVVAQATVVRPSSSTQLDMLVTEATSGIVHRTPEDRAVRLEDRVTDTFAISLDLRGDSKLSPIVYPWPQILTGNMLNTGTYYSRGIKADVGFSASVTFAVLKSGSGTAHPYVSSQKMVNGQPEIIEGVYQKEWLPLTLAKTEPVGDGWVEETYVINDAKGVGLDRFTQVHLNLSGTPKHRVYVRELRAIIK